MVACLLRMKLYRIKYSFQYSKESVRYIGIPFHIPVTGLLDFLDHLREKCESFSHYLQASFAKVCR